MCISRSSTDDWVVFLSVILVFVSNIGLSVSSGTLFPYILEEFQESRASTVAIQSLFNGVGLCSGINS